MSTLPPTVNTSSVEQTVQRIVRVLDADQVKLTPSQVDSVRRVVSESEAQEMLRVMTQILETLRSLNTADVQQSSKLDQVILALLDLKRPLEALSQEGQVRIERERAAISDRSNLLNKAAIPIITAIGSSLATALAAWAAYAAGG